MLVKMMTISIIQFKKSTNEMVMCLGEVLVKKHHILMKMLIEDLICNLETVVIDVTTSTGGLKILILTINIQ